MYIGYLKNNDKSFMGAEWTKLRRKVFYNLAIINKILLIKIAEN